MYGTREDQYKTNLSRTKKQYHFEELTDLSHQYFKHIHVIINTIYLLLPDLRFP